MIARALTHIHIIALAALIFLLSSSIRYFSLVRNQYDAYCISRSLCFDCIASRDWTLNSVAQGYFINGLALFVHELSFCTQFKPINGG